MEAAELLEEGCRLRSESLMLGRDTQLRQARMRFEARWAWLRALHAGVTWEQIEAHCGLAKFTLAKELAKARKEHPELAGRLPRNRAGVQVPCLIDGCEATFGSPQARHLHMNRRGGHIKKAS